MYAPAFFSVRAHSLMVVPVVTTSSMSTMDRPLHSGAAQKAPRRFFFRCLEGSSFCWGVDRVRVSSSRQMGICYREETY